MSIETLILAMLICGAITAAIGERKNVPTWQGWRGFLGGALLGIFGIILAACAKPGLPAAPPGMCAVKCPRCNAVQNVGELQQEYVCWQCHGVQQWWGMSSEIR